MSRGRGRLGIVSGLAGGSLLTGLPWPASVRVVRDLFEYDIVPVILAGLGKLLLGSLPASELFSWLLVLAILYVYTDRVYLGRVKPLTDRRGFRVLTAGIAGTVALLANELGGGRGLLAIVALMVVLIPIISGYLWSVGFNAFDPDGPLLTLLGRMAGSDPATLLSEYEDTTGLNRWIVGWSFYGAPAGIVTAVSLVLGLVILALLDMYPLPELAVLCLATGNLVDHYTDRRISQRLRRGIHLERRIVRSLSAATVTVEGLLLTLICLVGLVFSGSAFAVGTGLGRSFLADEIWGLLPALAGHANAILLFALMIATVGMLPVAFLVWGIYGILFWIRELQRLPGVVRDSDRINETAAAVDSTDSMPRRIPGAMLPANGFVLVTVGLFTVVVMPILTSLDSVEAAVASWPVFAGYLLVTGGWLWGCWRSIRLAWWGPTGRTGFASERLVIGIAMGGSFVTLTTIGGLLSALTVTEAVVIALVSMGAVPVLFGMATFADASVSFDGGRLSEDEQFVVLFSSVFVFLAAFAHWYYPIVSPWLPGILLSLAGLVVVLWRL